MPRSQKPVPSYALHKPTNQAYVRLPDGKGGRRAVYLGAYGSPESQAEYRRVLAEWQTPPAADATPAPASAPAPAPAGVTVNEQPLAFMRWAQTHYRDPAGEATTEIHELKWSLRPVRELYGHLPAAEFGPKALAAVRRRVVELWWSRTLINRRVDRVKRAFKWAAAEELVPVAVYQALRTFPGLQKGRTEARESEPVGPVAPAHAAATLPHLSTHLRAMAELQLLTGMRPGEACGLRFAEVDRGGAVWLYRQDGTPDARAMSESASVPAVSAIRTPSPGHCSDQWRFQWLPWPRRPCRRRQRPPPRRA